MKRLVAIVLAAWSAWSTPVVAWDDFGHMEVAAVAWNDLSPTIRDRAVALLKLNPQYQEWTEDVPNKDKGMVAFLRAATWPDFIRGAKGYKDDGAVPPNNATATRNIGYADQLLHRYWHFVDIPFSPDGTKLPAIVQPNAQTQIAAFREALASPADVNDDIRSYDLVWLLHLVGDIHQPLHATGRHTATNKDGDRGGNEVKVTPPCAQCKETRLHSYWDEILSPKQGDGDVDDSRVTPQEAMKAALALPKADPKLAATSDEKVWIGESFELAQAHVYRLPPIGHGNGPFVLTADYERDAIKLAKERVALAGARLANLLEKALK